MTRVYTPDLAGIANLMSDEAADQRNQLLFDASQMLSSVAMRHDQDESGDLCETCWDHGDESPAAWPCGAHQAAMRFALAWLMRRGA